MAIETADSLGTNFYRPPARDFSHELRTPLAVIRMQAQLLVRLVKRSGSDGSNDRERFIAGLQRIDDAVTKINLALEGAGADGRDDRRFIPKIH